MNDRGTVQVVLPAARSTILLRLLLGFGAAVAFLYWQRARDPHLFPFVAWTLVVVSAYTFYPLARLVLSGQAIVVTDQGLIDRTGALDFVKWTEIRSARVKPYMGLT